MASRMQFFCCLEVRWLVAEGISHQLGRMESVGEIGQFSRPEPWPRIRGVEWHSHIEADWYAATVAVDILVFVYVALFYQVQSAASSHAPVLALGTSYFMHRVWGKCAMMQRSCLNSMQNKHLASGFCKCTCAVLCCAVLCCAVLCCLQCCKSGNLPCPEALYALILAADMAEGGCKCTHLSRHL